MQFPHLRVSHTCQTSFSFNACSRRSTNVIGSTCMTFILINCFHLLFLCMIIVSTTVKPNLFIYTSLKCKLSERLTTYRGLKLTLILQLFQCLCEWYRLSHLKITCSPSFGFTAQLVRAKSFTSLVAHGAGAYLPFL